MRQTILAFAVSIMVASASGVQGVLADGSWTWVRNTITGAYGEAVISTGTALYIARGTKFYRYSPSGSSWTEMAAPPNPDSGDTFKTGTALAWDLGDHIYALYGAATSDNRKWFYRYSISGNSWRALADTTADQGEGDAMAWVSSENCIYATIGGEQRPTFFMRYDPSSDSWSNAPSDPPAGMGDGASLVWTGGNYLYALRGEFLEDSALYDFWRYSVSDDIWTSMSNIPAGPYSGGFGGVGDGGSLLYVGFWLPTHTDYIYALSGNQAYPESPAIPDNRTYRYTISKDSWERLADLAFGVGYYVGCRLGYADNHVYAWQGTPSTWVGGGDDLVRYEFPAMDLSPPTTTHSYDGSWHKTDFTIVLTATDDLSGVNQTFYRINNGPVKTVSIDGQPLISTESANNTLEYWSVDNVGHEESPHVLSGIKLDKTIPVGSITINNEAIYANSTSVTLHLNATDALSGTYGVRLSNDGIWDTEPWESVLSTRSWTLTSGDGNKTVYFQATDNAGLVSETYSAEITLDTIPPNITQVYQTPIANVMPENEVRIDAVILDANGIKLAVLNYTTGNGIWTLVDMTFTGKSVWNASIPAFPNGTTVTYAIITEDTAGNHITTDELGEHLQYNVIPELPSPILLLVLVIGTLLVVLLRRARALSCPGFKFLAH